MHNIRLIVYTMKVLLNMHVIGYTCYIDEVNSLYVQSCLLLHYDVIGSIEFHVFLRCAKRQNGL